MSSSAINQSVFQAKISNVQNAADSSGVYSAGAWDFKNASAVTSVKIDASGNVGIGTTSPTVLNYGRELTVSNTSGAQPEAFLCLQGAKTVDQNVGAMVFFNSATPISSIATTRVGANNSGALTFSTANLGTITERMRIDASGAITLGSTSGSTTAQHLISSFNNGGTGTVIQNRSTGGISLEIRSPVTSGSNDVLYYKDNNGDLCGYVTLNATANTVSYVNSSDARLKTNHRDFDGLDLVKQMKPSKYERICNPGVDEIGLVAQELALLLPEAVSEGSDDVNEKPWGVDYGRITPVLVKAIQELSAKNEALEARLAALESKP